LASTLNELKITKNEHFKFSKDLNTIVINLHFFAFSFRAVAFYSLIIPREKIIKKLKKANECVSS
jgi:hypothetical protein